ncbi:MAG: DUF6516 family protein [Candidatus Lokiarchaeia archaeon]
MLRTLELLKSSRVIEKFEVLDFKQGEDFYYLKIKAILKRGNELHIREYVSEKKYLYSFHWQDGEERLIIRWDTSPHYRHLRTSPHQAYTRDRGVQRSEPRRGAQSHRGKITRKLSYSNRQSLPFLY